VSWIFCFNNALIVGLGAPPTNVVIVHPFPSTPAANRSDRIHSARTDQLAIRPIPWDGWQVDQSSVADLKIWFDQHVDAKWAKFAGEVNCALQSKAALYFETVYQTAFFPSSPLLMG
jgi:hypothetical protein